MAIFPPRTSSSSREIELNLGYVWVLAKMASTDFSAGIRQAEHQEEYRPHGVSDEDLEPAREPVAAKPGELRGSATEPGTWRHLPVCYLVLENAEFTQRSVLDSPLPPL